MKSMKVIGRHRVQYQKGFTAQLNDFLELCAIFRASTRYIPRGVYRFKSFEEANEWNMRMLLGKKPKRAHRP